jgi:dihydrofolate reductase
MAEENETTKVIWHQTTTLDGFIAGPDGSGDWAFGHGGPSKEFFTELMGSIGAMVVGRRTYGPGPDNGKLFYGGQFTGPVFVLTHEPPEPPGPEDYAGPVRFVSGDLADVLAQARAAAGGKHVVLTGGDAASQFVTAGLVDEAIMHVVPILLGDGTRVFADPGPDWTKAETVDVSRSGAVATLHYRFSR